MPANDATFFPSLRQYAFERLSLHKARTWLERYEKRHPNGSEILAAFAMFHLNHHAQLLSRGSLGKETIYALKNEFVRFLYIAGRCVSAQTHFQNRKCFACDGTGSYYDPGDCRRCDGTGIYSSTRLYIFRFRVGDRSYSWHQPASLVNWNVTLTGPVPSDYVDALRNLRRLSYARYALLISVVYLFLHSRGVIVPLHPTRLRDALYSDLLEDPIRRWESRRDFWGNAWSDLSERLRNRREIDVTSGDDLPF